LSPHISQLSQIPFATQDPTLLRALAAGGIGLWDYEPGAGLIEFYHSVASFNTLPPGRHYGPISEFAKFIAPEDLVHMQALIAACSRSEKQVEAKFCVHYTESQTVWLWARGEHTILEDGRVRYIGTINDVTEDYLRKLRVQTYHEALFALVRDPRVADGTNFEAATAHLLTLTAQTLNVERASLWQLSEGEATLLKCKNLYDSRQSPAFQAPPSETNTTFFPADGILTQRGYPIYFESVTARRSLAVADALTDPVLIELREKYLPHTGVRALLDVPLFNRGKLWGIVCFETCTALRAWDADDESFASSAVDLISLALESSQRVRSEHELESAKARQHTFAQATTDPIWWVDIDPPIDVTLAAAEQLELIRLHGRITDANSSFADGYNQTVEALRNCLLSEIMPELFKGTSLRDWIDRGYQLIDRELTQRSIDSDRARWLSLTLLGVIDNGKLKRIWGARRNITERKRYQNMLEHLAFRDPLTGLLNRQRLVAEVSDSLDMLTKSASLAPCALLLLDLNQFKDVNDMLGHSAGDEVLRQMRKRLDKALENTDAIAARLGGDEFGIFARGVGTVDGAIALGETITKAMAEPFNLLGAKFHISASIGAAIFPAHGATFSTLSRAADEAMYQAKHSGGGVHVFSSSTVAFEQQKIGLLAHLPGAIERGELRLEFQPIVNCVSRKTVRMEALVRWHHPEHGRLEAKDFIHKAEMSDAIRVLTRWVVDRAFKSAAEWQSVAPGVGVSINISPRLLGDTSIVAHLKQRTVDYNLTPRLVDLEITETSMIHNPETASQVLAQCRALGFSIVMDDYGVGFCSLSYLRRLPLRGLKIDHSFVSNITRNAEDAIVVHSTITLAHNLGLTVVAEGVEDAETLNQLAHYSCDFAQGYGVSRPLSPDESIAWLKASNALQAATPTEYV
jgi:diguanylate cyclase (GGDEF)-like protein